MKLCYILRGIPGSGKSLLATTLANNFREKTIICEADDYFIKNGEYKYIAEQLSNAHKYCYDRFKLALKSQNNIIVSNTAIREWEFEKYYDEAIKNNYIVFSIIVESRHNGQCNKNIPLEHLLRMKERFEIKLI